MISQCCKGESVLVLGGGRKRTAEGDQDYVRKKTKERKGKEREGKEAMEREIKVDERGKNKRKIV